MIEGEMIRGQDINKYFFPLNVLTVAFRTARNKNEEWTEI